MKQLISKVLLFVLIVSTFFQAGAALTVAQSVAPNREAKTDLSTDGGQTAGCHGFSASSLPDTVSRAGKSAGEDPAS